MTSTPSNGITVRCIDCQKCGKERTFKSLDGYKRHVRDYHGAKSTDAVNIIRSDREAK